MTRNRILRVAVAAPVHRYFDYLPPSGLQTGRGQPELQPGQRLWVPFGRGRRLGLLVEIAERSELPDSRLKPALEVIDREPALPADLLRLLRFAADYYRQPPGEVFSQALPAALRRGTPLYALQRSWQLTADGAAADVETLQRRAPRQAETLSLLQAGPLADASVSSPEMRRALHALRDKDWVQTVEQEWQPTALPWPAPRSVRELNDEQAHAAAAIAACSGFGAHLLSGITGSGKTEVYMHCIAQALARGRQSLVLVPEIALTPQLLQRFRDRFGDAVVALHSGLADGERLAAWHAARSGAAAVIVGTRSALFVPLAKPGLLVLDEEHDSSYRQQDGVRYSARDLAVMRARLVDVPIVLGSATPSLESLRHGYTGRYTLLRLPRRVHGGGEPQLSLIDLTRHARRDGLSTPLIAAVERQLDAGGQVLLFLNRRGFAPALWCGECGHVMQCRRCDARLTLHHGEQALKCHHCGTHAAVPTNCPACRAELTPVGQGTERIERTLHALFPGVPVARVDRDAARRRGELERQLDAVRSGRTRILVGTQMLTKGHDFPEIGLVGVLDADPGLFSSDFRASEHLAQTIVQVAGRAGRAQRAGQVLIQTRFPQHPLLQRLIAEGYEGFARGLLEERAAAGWPPHTRLALLHAEAAQRTPVLAFLETARRLADGMKPAEVTLLGPAPAAMERRAGRYRHRLLLQAPDHPPLQRLLESLIPQLEALPAARKVRWVVDVDPVELL